jgi:hypothetical protein
LSDRIRCLLACCERTLAEVAPEVSGIVGVVQVGGGARSQRDGMRRLRQRFDK